MARSIVSVLMLLLGALSLGCARAPRVSGDAGALDPAPDVAATDVPSIDAGAPVVRDAGGWDVGGWDVPPTPRDAPAVALPDAPVDGGPAATSCLSALDVSSGGTFVLDTCMLPDSAPATCGVRPAFDAILAAEAPPTGSSYVIEVPPEWVIQQVDAACAPMTLSCSRTGSWSVSGATFPPRWYFAVSRASGECGEVRITVRRS